MKIIHKCKRCGIEFLDYLSQRRTYCSKSCVSKRPLPKTSKDKISGYKSVLWKGNNAKYQALHGRVRKYRGSPNYCEICGYKGKTTPIYYQWANITGNYLDINDYKRMCIPCHRAFDAKKRRNK